MDFLSPVLNLIGSQLIAEYARIHGISDKLKSWGEKLPAIQAILDSAEEKQMYEDDCAIVLWLAELRDMAYDMEDLLDSSVDAKRDSYKVQARSRSSKLPRCLFSCCSRFRPRTLISGHHMANEIEDIDRRLERVLSRIQSLQLVQNLRSRSPNDLPRFITTSLPEPMFVGRVKQLEELLARLTGSEAASDNSFRPFSVISIVGMGGLGKTTLAQELYNHESLKNADFVVKAWACVSDVFDMASITKSLLDQIAPSSSGSEKDLNQLQSSLREKLSGKKFFIVLDDVWNDKYEELESLLKPLYSGSKGSRILLTTRNFEVARLMGDRDPKQLEFMPLEECLSLLAYHSIGELNFEGHPHLQEISVQLAKKCKGLPLSIKTIGGMLRFEGDDEKWKLVLAHGSWERDGGKIPPALKLSYVHLPFRLKRCFAACAIFPKDYVFDQDELIRLWIVQGLLQKGTAKAYQEVGMENIHWLEAVSFLQKAREEKNCYTMHDLVNDLAKSVDARSYFSSDEGSTFHEGFFDKVRHAAMVTEIGEKCTSKRFDAFRSMKKLRTFMHFQTPLYRGPIPGGPGTREITRDMDIFANVHVSQDVIRDLIMGMKNLKVLSLRYFLITQVPDQIGQMKLLRSVDFSHTYIETLPESICDLVELQSILLRGCHKLLKLPRNIHKLANLLHLDLTDAFSLKEMPPRISDLTNLEILPHFVVGKEVGQELKQLGPLGSLQKELYVRNLMDVEDVQDARLADLRGKEKILKISLGWGSSSGIPREDDHQFELLHHLQPPRKIESLDIRGYGANRFPSWFGNHCCMENVSSITLTYCRSVDSLPPFGQLPSLERLDIDGLEVISSIGPEFYGSRRPFFRSLRRLSFKDMGAWEKWTYHGNVENDLPFPCLRDLTMRRCPKLKGGCTLCLPSLVEIEIDMCHGGLLKCLAGLTSMTKMTIEHIPDLVHFDGSLSTSWTALEEVRIFWCPRFKSFVEGDGVKRLPPKLKVLEIWGCVEKLFSFPDGGLPPSLRILKLQGCSSPPQLISGELPDSLEEVSLVSMDGLMLITNLVCFGSPLSQSLRILVISDCGSLTTLTESLQHLSALSELTLSECPALEMEIFPSLPYNLSDLRLQSCPKVKCLPHDMHHLTSLKSLCIYNCDGFTRLPPIGGLPPNLEEVSLVLLDGLVSITELVDVGSPVSRSLRKLEIISCGSLTTLTDGLQHMSALSELALRGCAELELEIFPSLPCNLSVLEIDSCPKVKYLPQYMHRLTSLKSLTIIDYEGIKSLPRGGPPPNLEFLWIGGHRYLNQLSEWRLRGLTSLRELRILEGLECEEEMVHFPPSGDAGWSRILPSSLVYLDISFMENLEKLGGGLRHHLTSLRTLSIRFCGRLRHLPDDGLPDSLEYLEICECTAELVEKCREGKGEYWHSHLRLIPKIDIR